MLQLTRILIILGTTMLHFTHALNKQLKEITAKWDPADPFNDKWQNELYDLTMEIGDAETFNFEQKDEGDEDRPSERDVILLTSDMYKKEFCADALSFEACTPPTKPWFIAFVSFKRSEK